MRRRRTRERGLLAAGLLSALVACGSSSAGTPTSPAASSSRASISSPSPVPAPVSGLRPDELVLHLADLPAGFAEKSRGPTSGSTAAESLQVQFVSSAPESVISAVVVLDQASVGLAFMGGKNRLLTEQQAKEVPVGPIGDNAAMISFFNSGPQLALIWTEGPVFCDLDVAVSSGAPPTDEVVSLAAKQDARVRAAISG